MPRLLPLAGLALIIASMAKATTVVAEEVPETNAYCSVMVTGQQNVWNYIGYVTTVCTPGDVLWIFTPGGGTEGLSIATLVCRFDRTVLMQETQASCVYRGVPRETRAPHKTP